MCMCMCCLDLDVSAGGLHNLPFNLFLNDFFDHFRYFYDTLYDPVYIYIYIFVYTYMCMCMCCLDLDVSAGGLHNLSFHLFLHDFPTSTHIHTYLSTYTLFSTICFLPCWCSSSMAITSASATSLMAESGIF